MLSLRWRNFFFTVRICRTWNYVAVQTEPQMFECLYLQTYEVRFHFVNVLHWLIWCTVFISQPISFDLRVISMTIKMKCNTIKGSETLKQRSNNDDNDKRAIRWTGGLFLRQLLFCYLYNYWRSHPFKFLMASIIRNRWRSRPFFWIQTSCWLYEMWALIAFYTCLAHRAHFLCMCHFHSVQ